MFLKFPMLVKITPEIFRFRKKRLIIRAVTKQFQTFFINKYIFMYWNKYIWNRNDCQTLIPFDFVSQETKLKFSCSFISAIVSDFKLSNRFNSLHHFLPFEGKLKYQFQLNLLQFYMQVDLRSIDRASNWTVYSCVRKTRWLFHLNFAEIVKSYNYFSVGW